MAYFFGFAERDCDGDGRDEENTAGIVVVFIKGPQDNTSKLENVEWIQNLKKDKLI